MFLLVPFAAACGAGGAPGGAGTPVAAPFAGCADLAQPPPGAPASPEGSGGAADPSLPALSLPCYSGGGVVDLRSLRGPAVVNLWASWCAPCRSELPVLRDFAARNPGTIRVIGVVSADSRSASTSLAVDLGLTYPNLYDESGVLLRALRRSGLPATVFLDRRGQIRTVYSGEAFDRATLDGLARNHLGELPR